MLLLVLYLFLFVFLIIVVMDGIKEGREMDGRASVAFSSINVFTFINNVRLLYLYCFFIFSWQFISPALRAPSASTNLNYPPNWQIMFMLKTSSSPSQSLSPSPSHSWKNAQTSLWYFLPVDTIFSFCCENWHKRWMNRHHVSLRGGHTCF